jgi:hypothetical protein
VATFPMARNASGVNTVEEHYSAERGQTMVFCATF